MWIMLIKKLPTGVSPPKMSLFYAYKHKPDREQEDSTLKVYLKDKFGLYSGKHINEMERDKEYRKKLVNEIKDKYIIHDYFGGSPNEFGAVWIFYKEEKIKVWPHEYSVLTKENFKLYITESHVLIPNDEVQEMFVDVRLGKGQRTTYDAALVDGCDKYEATMVALGKDPTEFPPPMGWYKCKEHLASVYCYDWEMVG